MENMVGWWVESGEKFMCDGLLDKFDGGLHDDRHQTALGHRASPGNNLICLS
jgi:hypothetical protein